jgi:hypothetical protein
VVLSVAFVLGSREVLLSSGVLTKAELPERGSTVTVTTYNSHLRRDLTVGRIMLDSRDIQVRALVIEWSGGPPESWLRVAQGVLCATLWVLVAFDDRTLERIFYLDIDRDVLSWQSTAHNDTDKDEDGGRWSGDWTTVQQYSFFFIEFKMRLLYEFTFCLGNRNSIFWTNKSFQNVFSKSLIISTSGDCVRRVG